MLSFRFLSLVRDRGGFANHAVAEKWALLVINILHRCLPPPEAAVLKALLPHPFDTDLRADLRAPSAQRRQPPVVGSHDFLLHLCIQKDGGLTDSEATRRITAILETVSDFQNSSPHSGGPTALDHADAVVGRALRPGNGSAATGRSRRAVSAYHDLATIPDQQGSR